VTTVYLDCFSGIAGDMLVGALLDLGASPDAIRDGLAQLDLDGYEIVVREVERGPIRATKFEVLVAGHVADSAAHDEHAHAHLPSRGLREIRALIEPAALPGRVKERALAAFGLLAQAEGRVHGMPPEEVHFHEVGAVDAICDVVGVALALEDLGVTDVRCGPLHAGSGFVQCDHGRLPVPAPATLECLAGFDVRMDAGRGELVTPTGACLVGALARPGAPREWSVRRVGYGAGTRDPEDVPNVVRAVLGDVAGVEAEPMVELRTNVDHLAPNVLAAALDRVREAGAVEVFTTPCTMKKGRSGHLVTALTPASCRGAVECALFRETGTLGIRVVDVTRSVLERSFETVSTPWGGVRVKVGRHGGRVTSREPELEDCRSLAEQHGVPVADVVAAARRG
jgi:uncharacterized protein (TIGR00299 family) protein